MKCKVVVFPGSNCDSDCFYVLNDLFKKDVSYVWHKESDLGEADLIVLPGGFSYGDYLRTGSIARFSPIMKSVIEYANNGGAVIGICNGFQVLLESGLLPGAMLRNKSVHFECRYVTLKVKENKSLFTNKFKDEQLVSIPIAHGEGNYYCDDAVLKNLQDNEQIAFTYCSENGVESEEFNPNGSRNNIAGIFNEEKNVLGMMPHPERACETMLGGEDGKLVWESIFSKLK